MNKRTLLAAFALVFLFQKIAFSQCTAGNSCYSAPLLCGSVLNGFSSATGGPNSLSHPAAFCGVIENNQWIAFVACQPTVVLNLNVAACQGTFTGSGLQAQIFQTIDCQAFTPVSNCFNPGSATSGTLTATGLTPGAIYYLMVDGWAGDICSYSISVVAGVDLQPPAPQVQSAGFVSGPTAVCPNTTASFTAVLPVCSNISGSDCPMPSGVQNSNLTYSWSLPSGATVVGNANSNTISILFGTQSGSIACTATAASSGSCGCNWACPTTIAPLQITVETQPTQVTTLPTVTICEGQSYTFCGINYTTSASPICTNPTDCTTATMQPIVVLPNNFVNLGTQILCGNDCFSYQNETFCNAGIFQNQIQNGSTCETISVEIQKIYVDGYWSPSNILHPAQPTATLNGNGSSNGATNGQVTFQWSGPDITTANQNQVSPTVGLPGTYVVTVTDVSSGCTFTFSVVVTSQPHDCNLPAPPGDFCQFCPTFCGKELDSYCSFTENFSGEYPGNLASQFCGGMENSAWLQFFPCEPTVKLRLTPSDCAENHGIEAAILETNDCQFFQKKSNCVVGLAADTLVATGLTPGKNYFLMVDGKFGDRCKWELDVLAGIRTEPVEVQQTQPPKVSGPATACPGQTTQFSLQPPDCQVVSSGNCPFDALLDSLSVRWFVPPGGQIVGDSTTLNCSVKWNAGPGGDVFAIVKSKLTGPETFCVALNGCSDFAKQNVVVKFSTETLPPIFLCNGQTTTICGQTVSTTTDVHCPDVCGEKIQPVVVKNPKREDFGTISICPDAAYILAGNAYKTPGFYQILAQNGVCVDTIQFNLTLKNEPPLALSTVSEDCDAFGQTYRVKFDFAAGVPPFFINGQPVGSGPTYQTNPIINQLPYFLTVTDSGSCADSTLILMGQKDCKCVSFAGLLPLDTLAACPPNSLKINKLGGEILDADDLSEFILTDKKDTLGQIIAINQTGIFSFQPSSMTLGKTYFISLVAGNSLDGGFVDLTDRCLSVADGQPIVFWPPPLADAGPDLMLDCLQTSLPLTGSASAGSPQGVDFQWITSPPSSFSSASQNPIVTTAGSYFLTVKDRWTGCTASDEALVSKIIVEPSVVAASDTIFCQKLTATLTASSPTAGSTIFWVGPTGDSLFKNPILTDEIGLFRAVAVGPNGCISEATATVVDGRKPIPHSIPSVGKISCYLPDYQVVTTVGLPNCQVIWTGPNGFSTTNFSFQTNQAGLYFLKIIEPTAGCTALDTLEILDRREPILSSVLNGSITCYLPDFQLVTTADLPNCTFSWTGPSGFSSSLQSPVVSAAGSYFLKITGPTAGCEGSDTASVLDNREPILSSILNGSITCYLPDFQLVTTTDLPNCTFSWTGPSGFSSSLQSPIVSAAGSYFLKITGPTAGCEGSNSTTILDEKTPPEAVILPPDSLTCDRQSVSLDGSASTTGPTIFFEWKSLDGWPVLFSNQNLAVASAAGGYKLTLTNAQNGCTDEAMTTVFENTNRPTALEIEETEPTCTGFADGFLTIKKVVGGEAPFLFSIENSPFFIEKIIDGLSAGYFELVVRDKNGCTFLEKISLAEPPPVLVEIGPDREIELGESVEIEATTSRPFSEMTMVEWAAEPIHFSQTGGQTVSVEPFSSSIFTILVADANGCEDRDSLRVSVRRRVPIFVPNVFKPSNDERLSIFCGAGVSKIVRFEVFDRWGSQLFRAADFAPSDENGAWDGRFRGKNVAEGVYFWWTEVELVDGRRMILKGDVTVAR